MSTRRTVTRTVVRLAVAAPVVGTALCIPSTDAVYAAAASHVAAPVLVSGGVPLGPGCSAANGNSPHAAADPSRPGHVTVVYAAGNAVAGIVATSSDGGSSWSRTALPGLTSCSGGPDGGFGDPMVAVGANGRTLTSVGWVTNDPSVTSPNPVRLLLNRSDDRGHTFAAPVEPEPGSSDQRGPLSFTPGSDSDVLVAFERTHYVNQPQFDAVTGGFVPGTGGSIGVARSTDGGSTWQPAVDAVSGAPGTDVVTVALLRSGKAVVLIYASADDSTIPAWLAGRGLSEHLFSVESYDGGRTWTSGASPIGTYLFPHGQTVGCCIPDAAVSPDATLYVTWPHVDTSDPVHPSYDAIDVATSHDAGRTWTMLPSLGAQVGATGPGIAEPAIAAGAHSSLGLLFYEADASGALTPEVAVSPDSGLTWSTAELGGPFNPDAVKGGSSDGPPLGPYQDLVAVPGGFGAVVTRGNGPTENVWWDIVQPG
jgi:hypothetical protein